jgi:hypothetical protein
MFCFSSRKADIMQGTRVCLYQSIFASIDVNFPEANNIFFFTQMGKICIISGKYAFLKKNLWFCTCVKSAFLDVQKANETLKDTVDGGFHNSSLEACRCNNICHWARFHGFKIEKHIHLSGLTVYDCPTYVY